MFLKVFKQLEKKTAGKKLENRPEKVGEQKKVHRLL